MMKRTPVAIALFTVCLLMLVAPWTASGQIGDAVERWQIFEAVYESDARPAKPMDLRFSATFVCGDQRILVPGFWDGGRSFKVRFSPPTTGTWRYSTSSDDTALDAQSGEFEVVPPSEQNHGPIEIFKTYYLRYADGTPYHQFGTTCYAWVHQPLAMQQQTLETLAGSPFNKIRFCVFPKHYSYNRNEPERFAFSKRDDGSFDFAQPDPEFWRAFEGRILDLDRLGIQADIILWHPYDRWGFKTMSDEVDDRYLRYCIARLSAYRNVWWSLANEYDFMTNQEDSRKGNKQDEDWDRFFSILEREDPHHRMRGIHNGGIWYDHTQDWVTHASLQTSDMNSGVKFRERYRKPVIYDECKYEGNIRQGWGNLTPREMTQRFWLGTMSGCYVGHGETYEHPEDLLWWAKGGVLRGESPARIAWLKKFMESAPPFDELVPQGDGLGEFMLGKDREYYLVYCQAGRSQQVKLPGDVPYKIDAIDPWRMTESPIGTLAEEPFTATAPDTDLVYRFIPYADGERLRPIARPIASVTEGIAPLTVRFDSRSEHDVRWSFHDGESSTEQTATRTFTKPGIYTVKLTVTDEHEASSRGDVVILVDRDSTKPIVVAGSTGADSPELIIHGTASRAPNGTLVFPDGEPWGRMETEEPYQDVAALRSFTIAGWLKPESLKVGSGGNRILFCLQRDTAGIDLVHHSDGRLRLSVNEWPDRVKNDSSPGKLLLGKWTCFVVTYDGTRDENNVMWYFSDPAESPTPDPSFQLDRTVSYPAGPVATRVGRLAVGNFNQSMQGSGWDRQFRGEIRELRLFGSRIDKRGAFDKLELQTRLKP